VEGETGKLEQELTEEDNKQIRVLRYFTNYGLMVCKEAWLKGRPDFREALRIAHVLACEPSKVKER